MSDGHKYYGGDKKKEKRGGSTKVGVGQSFDWASVRWWHFE